MINKQKIFLRCFSILVFCFLSQIYNAQNIKNFFSRDKIKIANTAAKENYLDDFEKEIILLINLARTEPKNFLKFYQANLKSNHNKLYFGKKDFYHKSLVKKLGTMKPVQVLEANNTLTEFAQCWASYCGDKGITGHDKKHCKSNYSAQCCAYGGHSARDVVWMLLIDRGVKSLGHREICLSESVKQIGVAKAKHSKYGQNAVLDFQ